MMIRFNQMNVICRHFTDSIMEMPAGVYDDFLNVRQKAIDGLGLTDEDLTDLLIAGSNFGAIIRTAHYRFVDGLGYESQAFWDSLIKTFVMTGSGIFNPQFKEALKDKRMKGRLNRTRFPKWVRFGLIGGSRQELNKMTAEFKSYMDELDERS